MRLIQTYVSLACLVLFLFYTPPAMGTPIQAEGQLNMMWSSYSGTTSAVLVDLGSGPVSTGLISFDLDTSPGLSNFFNIDWDAGMASIQLNLLTTFPLLNSLGITDPVKMIINESGSLDSIPWVEPGATDVNILTSSTMFGGGTVSEGIFSGFTFENDNIWNIDVDVNVGIGNGNTIQIGTGNSTSTHTGNITQPGGIPQPTSGSGLGTTVVPEPSTMLLLITGLLCFIGFSRATDVRRYNL